MFCRLIKTYLKTLAPPSFANHVHENVSHHHAKSSPKTSRLSKLINYTFLIKNSDKSFIFCQEQIINSKLFQKLAMVIQLYSTRMKNLANPGI